jgi:hypothetical protein
MWRPFSFQKSTFYIYKNTCLLRQLRVEKDRTFDSAVLVINGVEIQPSSYDSKYLKWDFGVIRPQMREMLGLTAEEHTLLRVENTLVVNQFEAKKFYDLPDEEFGRCVFTSGLQIGLKPLQKGKISCRSASIKAEEEVHLSSISK